MDAELTDAQLHDLDIVCDCVDACKIVAQTISGSNSEDILMDDDLYRTAARTLLALAGNGFGTDRLPVASLTLLAAD